MFRPVGLVPKFVTRVSPAAAAGRVSTSVAPAISGSRSAARRARRVRFTSQTFRGWVGMRQRSEEAAYLGRRDRTLLRDALFRCPRDGLMDTGAPSGDAVHDHAVRG